MISEQTIQLVKQRTDIVAVIGETVKLQRAGRMWKGLCPFHKERGPSFVVTPERGTFHCFGCQKHGNVISFVMEVEGLSFPEAVRKLADRAGIEIVETGSDRERREEEQKRKARDELYGAMRLAALYYEKMLAEHPNASVAWDEIEKRGLKVEQPTDLVATTLQAFRIGYAPDGWDGLTTFLREQGISPAVAEQVGLLVPRKSGPGHYDRFRHRLMFAVVDLQGRVVAFSGRVLPHPKTGIVDSETGKYVNSPETPIYRKGETVFGLFQARQAIREAGEVIVVEGNFDVVSLHARGIGNVVAPLGTAFTPEQATLLKRFAPTAILLFDGDAAGRKAIRAAREPCKRAGLVAKAAVLPRGKDPDELAREKGRDGILAVTKAARGLLEHLIDAALDESFLTADAEERAARAREVAALLASEDDPTVRAMAQKYADDVAGRLASADPRTGMVDVTTFRALHRATLRPLATRDAREMPPDAISAGNRASAPRIDPVLGAVLGCLFDFPSLLHDPEVAHALGHLNGDAVFVVAALRKATDGPERADDFFDLDAEEVLANVPPLFHAFARHRLSAPVHDDVATAKRELLVNAEKLKVRALSRENEIVGQEAARAVARGDEDEAVAMLREVQERARKKRGLT